MRISSGDSDETTYIAPEELKPWHLYAIRRVWALDERQDVRQWYRYYFGHPHRFDPDSFEAQRLISAERAIVKERMFPTFNHRKK